MTMNTRCVCFDETLDNLTASGILRTKTAGEGVAFGDVCYRKSDGKWWKADADIDATLKGELLMAIATILADDEGVFLKMGRARNDAWNWTVGGELWVSTTPGIPTQIKPDNARLVGQSEHADYLYFGSDGSIEREFAHQEIHEHFIDSLMSPGGYFGCLYTAGFTLIKETASITRCSGTGGEIWGMKCHNPSDYIYYQMDWRWKIDSTSFESEIMGIIDQDVGEEDYCYVLLGTNANTVKFVTRHTSGTPEVTDNIAVDITTLHKYTIKIKSGQVKFYIDNVLKATHSTQVPYDVTEGLVFITTWGGFARIWDIDYLNVLLGRSF